MSLINEALKRARVEAARREAAEKGVPVAAQPVYVAPQRKTWVGPFLGFLAGLVVVAGAGAAYWLSRPEAPAPSDPQPATVVATAAEPDLAEPSAPGPAEPSVGSPEAVEPSPPQEPAAVRPAAPPVAVQREPARGAPPPAASPPAAPPPAAPPPAAPPPSAPVEPSPTPGASAMKPPSGPFVREAVLPGDETIKLDFIVWSESRPFAQINGELVRPGQMVGAYVLRTVERERVELEAADGASFWIRAK